MIASLTTEKNKLRAEKSKQGNRLGGLERSVKTKERWITAVMPLMKVIGVRSGRPVEAVKINRAIERLAKK